MTHARPRIAHRLARHLPSRGAGRPALALVGARAACSPETSDPDAVARWIGELSERTWVASKEQQRPLPEVAAVLLSDAPADVERYLAGAFLADLAAAHGRRTGNAWPI